jgi:hypothetical protein
MTDEWAPVPGGLDACRVADLVLSQPKPGHLHLSVIVKAGALPLALSSAEKLGVYVTRARTIAGIEGVYRWVGAAD